MSAAVQIIMSLLSTIQHLKWNCRGSVKNLEFIQEFENTPVIGKESDLVTPPHTRSHYTPDNITTLLEQIIAIAFRNASQLHTTSQHVTES
jgi:hypothetical protein